MRLFEGTVLVGFLLHISLYHREFEIKIPGLNLSVYFQNKNDRVLSVFGFTSYYLLSNTKVTERRHTVHPLKKLQIQ